MELCWKCDASVMKINWRDVLKFLSGAFFCYSRGELVFFLAWHECSYSFLWIFSNDTGILVLSRLHPFRPVSDLLLFRVHQKMIGERAPGAAGANHGSGLVTAPRAERRHDQMTNAATCARFGGPDVTT
jgi:hypothetical protein